MITLMKSRNFNNFSQQCRPWDITQQTNQNDYAESLIEETLAIAGAQVNIHKLLGIHEQIKLVNAAGNGRAISGGDIPEYPSANAFTMLTTEWRSRQSGSALVQDAFIGYDFGEIKLPNGRQRYGIEANERRTIATIKIKQGNNSKNRVTKVRVERSDDGRLWYGVSVLTLPNDNNLNTLHFRSTVPSRFWRLRPLLATSDCDVWVIQALEMSEHVATAHDNIQDKILLENRDREYATDPITMKGYYEIVAPFADLGAHGGLKWDDSYTIRLPFSACVARLGRPIVVGDIIELPSEVQYTPALQPIKRFLEVKDVGWDANSYTPGWMPTLLSITAIQAIASQETQDIFGALAKKFQPSGLMQDVSETSIGQAQNHAEISDTVRNEAKTQVPERGSEGSNVFREFTEEEIASAGTKGDSLHRLNFDRTAYSVEDGMPQNGAKYTEGPVLPTTPQNAYYHRLTYEGLAKDIPPRLYRWSDLKMRWIYIETDRRAQLNSNKPIMQEYLHSPDRISPKNIR